METIEMYQVLLTKEEWDAYFKNSTRFINNLKLPTYDAYMELGEFIINLQEKGANNQYFKINTWITEYNNKLSKIDFNFAYVLKYYELLGDADAHIETDYAKKNYHYWFSYEIESLLYRMFGLEDCLYHIIVEKFDLNVANKMGFKESVVTQMKKKNNEFGQYLSRVKKDKDSRYINAINLRNSFTHNYSPLNPLLNEKLVETKESINYLKPTYNYDNPIDIINIVEEFAAYLDGFLIEFKKYIY